MSDANSFKGSEAARKAYMRSYMAHRRADRVRVNNLVALAEHAPRSHGDQKELRDHSGTLMWPTRCIDRATSANIAEVTAALGRRKRGTGHG
jgi:hypothetical protein